MRIVQGQLEGIGNDGGFAPQATGMKGNTEAPDLFDLFDCLEEVPMTDGDIWLGELLKRNPRLAIRIIDVRKAYMEDFNWEKLRHLTQKGVEAGGQKLLQDVCTRAPDPAHPASSGPLRGKGSLRSG